MCTLLYTNQVMWSYIVGMLTNLGKLPLDRILMMLKMFAMQGSTSSHDCTPAELKVFLDKKVKEQQLTCSGGLYQLKQEHLEYMRIRSNGSLPKLVSIPTI